MQFRYLILHWRMQSVCLYVEISSLSYNQQGEVCGTTVALFCFVKQHYNKMDTTVDNLLYSILCSFGLIKECAAQGTEDTRIQWPVHNVLTPQNRHKLTTTRHTNTIPWELGARATLPQHHRNSCTSSTPQHRLTVSHVSQLLHYQIHFHSCPLRQALPNPSAQSFYLTCYHSRTS